LECRGPDPYIRFVRCGFPVIASKGPDMNISFTQARSSNEPSDERTWFAFGLWLRAGMSES
jgi:hypothetical protein